MSFRSLMAFGILGIGVIGIPILAQEIPIKLPIKVQRGERPETSEPPIANPSDLQSKETPKKLPFVNEKQIPQLENSIDSSKGSTEFPSNIVPVQMLIAPNTRPSNPLPTPIVTIDVVGSDTAAEGAELKYSIVIQNRSEAKAHHVLVRCPIPKNGKYVKSSIDPKVEQSGERSELQWQFGTLNPGESKSIEVYFLPNPNESEFRVIGRVQIDHGRWLGTKISKPTLTVKKFAPKEATLYEAVTYRVEVSNPGRVVVSDIEVKDKMGDGLEYKDDPMASIDFEKNTRNWKIARLNPGEKKVLEYTVIAKKVGTVNSVTNIVAGEMKDSTEHQLLIKEAKLEMKFSGIDRVTISQEANYQIVVQNKGTAILNNVRISLTHPSDLEVKKTSSGAQFFKETIQWVLPKLNTGESRTLSTTMSAKVPGKRKLSVSIRADRGLEQKEEITTEFEGISSIDWKTNGTPVANVGKEVQYLVEVSNPGSAPTSNVILQVALPSELEFKQANPLYSENNRMLVFRPIASLPPKAKATFAITCIAKQKGVAQIRFDLMADCLSKSGSLRNEVSTTINSDTNNGTPKDFDRVGARSNEMEKLNPVEERKELLKKLEGREKEKKPKAEPPKEDNKLNLPPIDFNPK